MRGGDGNVQGGVVIGPRTFLTADDFDNLRATPDLVFLNCCHLGQIRAGLDAADGGILDPVGQQVAAAGLASALMRIGVKAVVVAGWQVDDQIASRFAGEFYRRLLEGLPYGEAVKQARMACFAAGNGRDNTWAAYQCYGDPAFRLWRQVDGDRGEVSEMTMRSVALRSLEDLRTNSEEADDHVSLRNEVAALDEQVTARWADDGELLDRVAATWASIGDYQRAIDRFEAAIGARHASAPLSAIELLADLCSRRALELHREGRDGAEVEALLERADHWMGVLVNLGRDTRERHALDGGSCERLAILRPDQRDLYIQRAIAAYIEAAKDDPGDLGGFRTAIQLAAVNGGGRGTSLEDVLSTGDRVVRWTTDIVEAVEGGAPFAERVGHADSKLTAALIDGQSELGARVLARLTEDGEPAVISAVTELIENGLSSQVDALAGAYAGVRVGGFPNLGWRGVVEHIADLAELTAAAELSAADPMRRLLGRLEGLGQ
jgi:tetratricopeptide (TPR) repeat protein